MKYNLLGAVSTIALGAAFGIGAPVAANAALTCSGPGLTGAGAWSCTETVGSGPTKTDFSSILTLDKWIASGGNGFSGLGLTSSTLNSVSWSVGGTLTSVGSLTNNTGGVTTFSFNENERFKFANTVGAPTNFIANPLLINASSAAQTFTTVASGAIVTISPISLTLGPVTGTTTSLAGWSGGGTFAENFSTLSGFTFAGGGNNIVGHLTTSASPSITLTYNGVTTAQAPEPISMALMGTGLVGLGAIRRRRKA